MKTSGLLAFTIIAAGLAGMAIAVAPDRSDVRAVGADLAVERPAPQSRGLALAGPADALPIRR